MQRGFHKDGAQGLRCQFFHTLQNEQHDLHLSFMGFFIFVLLKCNRCFGEREGVYQGGGALCEVSGRVVESRCRMGVPGTVIFGI